MLVLTTPIPDSVLHSTSLELTDQRFSSDAVAAFVMALAWAPPMQLALAGNDAQPVASMSVLPEALTQRTAL